MGRNWPEKTRASREVYGRNEQNVRCAGPHYYVVTVYYVQLPCPAGFVKFGDSLDRDGDYIAPLQHIAEAARRISLRFSPTTAARSHSSPTSVLAHHRGRRIDCPGRIPSAKSTGYFWEARVPDILRRARCFPERAGGSSAPIPRIRPYYRSFRKKSSGAALRPAKT